MNVIAYRDNAAFDVLESEWNALLERAPINQLFCTWEWQKTWWDAYQPGELLVLACRDGEQLRGIAPLFIVNSERGRSIQIIGCVDVTDYLDFIVDESHLEDVFTAFAEYFSAHRADFDILDFCNIPFDSPTQRILPELLKSRGFGVVVEQQEVCPVIELPANWPGYLGLLDKKQRHEVRRKIRRVQGSDKAIDWYIVNGCHNLDDEVEEFVRLMAASDPEKEAFLRDDGNLRFFKAIVPLLQERGWLQMNFLTVNERRAAAYINFVYGNRVMVYNSGLDHQDYGDLSPGIVLLGLQYPTCHRAGIPLLRFLARRRSLQIPHGWPRHGGHEYSGGLNARIGAAECTCPSIGSR